MKKDKTLTIRLTTKEMERIEKMAKKIGLTKTQTARNLILVGLEDAEFYNKLGLFDMAKAILKLREKALGYKYKKLQTYNGIK